MTQEVIAAMLDVRRETVTAAVLVLQNAELISYSRERINLLNLLGLKARACECHGLIAKEFQRLLG